MQSQSITYIHLYIQSNQESLGHYWHPSQAQMVLRGALNFKRVDVAKAGLARATLTFARFKTSISESKSKALRFRC